MFYIKVCRWLDSDCGPLASEATALPTEPQPQPTCNPFVKMMLFDKRAICDKHNYKLRQTNSRFFYYLFLPGLFSCFQQLFYWDIHGLFFCFFSFCLFDTVLGIMQLKVVVKISDDWSQTLDLWCRQWPLYQLHHNHWPVIKSFEPRSSDAGSECSANCAKNRQLFLQ